MISDKELKDLGVVRKNIMREKLSTAFNIVAIYAGRVVKAAIIIVGIAALGGVIVSTIDRAGAAVEAHAKPIIKSHIAHKVVKHRIRRHKKCVCHCIIMLDKPIQPAKVTPSVEQIEGVLTNDTV